MNQPAPFSGRSGWVCAALLLGLFAGSGITWALVRRHQAVAPLVVYQLSTPPGAVMDATTVVWEDPASGSPRPSPRFDGDRILRTHHKAEGCLANALAALASFTKEGYLPRETVWTGEVSLEEGKAVSCQLFKGNRYCFCVGTDAKGAKVSLQLYDGDGTPADAELAGQELTAGASASAAMQCRQTGTYFVVVKLEATTQEKVPWGMVYAYR